MDTTNSRGNSLDQIELDGRRRSNTRSSSDHMEPHATMSFEDLDRIMKEDEKARHREVALTRPQNLLNLIGSSLNFYRVHLLVFTFVPLILSGIFYACNTEYHIDYIDALFCCVSAMTVTGLATINLSQLSGWQQTMLFLQMLIGSPVFVSLIMITVRKYFFQLEFDHIIESRRQAMREKQMESGGLTSPLKKLRRFSQTFVGEKPGQAASQRTPSWRDRLKSRMQAKNSGKGPSDITRDTPPSEDSSHEEGSTWKKDDVQGGIQSVHDKTRSTYGQTVTDSGRNTPAREYAEKEQQRPAMSRNSSTWGWAKGESKTPQKPKIRADMIKRVEGGGVGLINPMGWYQTPSSGAGPGGNGLLFQPVMEPGPSILGNPNGNPDSQIEPFNESPTLMENEPLPTVVEGVPTRPKSPEISTVRRESEPIRHDHVNEIIPAEDKFPRTKTIAFDRLEEPPRTAYASGRDTNGMYQHTASHGYMPRTGTIRSSAAAGYGGNGLERTVTGRRSVNTMAVPATRTMGTGYMPRTMTINQAAKHQNFGGFPTPLAIGKAAFNRLFPDTGQKLKKTLTLHQTVTQGGTITGGDGISEIRPVDYISFDAVVGRNSNFQDLTKEEYDELGGVEYRSLSVLFWIVLTYYLGTQFLAFIVIAPYTHAKYKYVFESTDQYRYVPPYWFSAFQAVSSFSNTGMSLVDKSMLPFQEAYPMIFIMFVLIFAGNTAFPIFLRFIIWLVAKVTPSGSRVYETLRFLLDHPRRCFVYLFPSTQTWFLFLVMVTLTLTDWVSFLVLDIGTPDIEAIPVGVRVADGFLQSAAVRAAGFGIVPLASLAPAVKVLYVVMQYISVYPIAMSIRSTNVYEEKSLGVWQDDEEGEEPQYQGHQAVAKYLGWHARRQLAFDIWWLAFALWLICIIERGQLNDTENATWFTIFNVIFELVSAYGTVGLSLGVAYDNFSFSGSFSVLSKLVIIAVMIRGRHRGLPVAIDRAIMLPKDFTKAENIYDDDQERLERRATRRGSVSSNPNTAATFQSAARRESNFSGGHRRTSSGDGLTIVEPGSPTRIARRLSSRSNGSQPDPRPDRSPERVRTFSIGRAGGPTDLNGLPRSLSTVVESGLSRAPTLTHAT